MNYIRVLALCLLIANCRATVPSPDSEAVGQLATGPSVYSAPVHATTDLTPGFQVVDTGDEAPTEVAVTETRAVDGGAASDASSDAEMPEAAPKGTGLILGKARD